MLILQARTRIEREETFPRPAGISGELGFIGARSVAMIGIVIGFAFVDSRTFCASARSIIKIIACLLHYVGGRP